MADAVEAAARRRSEAPVVVVEEEKVLSLDELFRKTVVKPCLYYLPLTEAQVAEKKQKVEVAEKGQKVEAEAATAQ